MLLFREVGGIPRMSLHVILNSLCHFWIKFPFRFLLRISVIFGGIQTKYLSHVRDEFWSKPLRALLKRISITFLFPPHPARTCDLVGHLMWLAIYGNEFDTDCGRDFSEHRSRMIHSRPVRIGFTYRLDFSRHLDIKPQSSPFFFFIEYGSYLG